MLLGDQENNIHQNSLLEHTFSRPTTFFFNSTLKSFNPIKWTKRIINCSNKIDDSKMIFQRQKSLKSLDLKRTPLQKEYCSFRSKFEIKKRIDKYKQLRLSKYLVSRGENLKYNDSNNIIIKNPKFKIKYLNTKDIHLDQSLNNNNNKTKGSGNTWSNFLTSVPMKEKINKEISVKTNNGLVLTFRKVKPIYLTSSSQRNNTNLVCSFINRKKS